MPAPSLDSERASRRFGLVLVALDDIPHGAIADAELACNASLALTCLDHSDDASVTVAC
jgi:hypothetical protein